MHSLDSFQHFTDFLLSQGDTILSSPINGELWKVRGVFLEFCKEDTYHTPTTYTDFIDYLRLFQTLSGGSLHFSTNLSHALTSTISRPRLIWINFTTIKILHYRLRGLAPPKKQPARRKEAKSLLDFISQKASTPTVELGQVTRLTVEVMTDFLHKVTARTSLGRERAKLRTFKVPFPQVCSDSKHALQLANSGLNKREYISSSKQLASEYIVHQRIQQARNALSAETYQCSLGKIHFLPILYNHTDVNLGDCSYLDTCHKMRTCRYLHYFTLNPLKSESAMKMVEKDLDYTIGQCFSESFRSITPPQWINCDVRSLPFGILGKFAVIISDPAWDIHMSLPYGTCKDDELLELPMHELQDEGIIMLWVTGRSIEIGRRALRKWGYQISDEMIWIKLNQLKRTIVTGRTGHWLNHSKEHLLVGLKGDPRWLNLRVDTDVVVSSTRETSRKPDEFYDIIERLVGPHARKLEIFGRAHNTRPGWLTIGNQLQGVSLHEPEVKYNYEMYISQNPN
ncbi:IME4 [Candida theae]|uniref:mRNA m(6)A methyltransferase n=1 Tax=Candida theae TaxID=1198502 RepID=A0AAD5BBP4_9ASCO|nr:IME4 [Candida theae]KAI5950024.1 IME4 [Candida theae]